MPIHSLTPTRKAVLLTLQSLFFFGVLPSVQAVELAVPAAEATIDFNRQIRPLLAKHCFACHGGDVAESSLRLDHRDSAVAESDSGLVAIQAGEPENSELLRRIRSAEDYEQMPPEGDRLEQEEIALLEKWIGQGAEYSQHWSFQPRTDPDIPAVQNEQWVRNPIDAFLLDKLEAAALTPNPPADARTLLRRLYYNLTGLPPTIEQVDAFEAAANDPATFEDAYQQTCRDLLTDPGFGEHWARHWLDVVRYAETNSYERDGDKPNAWRYRDYVIDALNKDKPYDQFIREQLAGDELPDPTREQLIATGYYRLGVWDDEPADKLQAKFDGLDDLVTTTSQGFLGLTLNCARCHDHKIDPLLQRDYYSMVSFFADITPYDQRSAGDSSSHFDFSDEETRQQRTMLNSHIERIESVLYEIEQSAIVKMDAADQRATEGPERKRILRQKLQSFLSEEQFGQYRKERREVKRLSDEIAALPSQAGLGLAKSLVNPPETHLLQRGSPNAPGAVVEPRFISLLVEADQSDRPEIVPAENSSGRRLALANWIASDENWMTARVIVNRIWQHHFGRGIVRSSNNFGQLGEIPTHPELLDYLAGELLKNDWSLKSIHRLILDSNAYRMSSQDEPQSLGKDPRNDLFWRFDARRLSAEELRDSMLAVAGKLNRKMGGPSFYPDVSDEVKAGQSRPGAGWGESSKAERSRRSIYIFIKRSLVPPELSVFDFPESDGTCEARFLTNQAAQALNLLNGQYSRQSAGEVATHVEQQLEAGGHADSSLDQLVGIAIQDIYQRPVQASDLTLAKRFVTKMQQDHQLSFQDAWQTYCLVLLNTNEFLYID